MNGLAPGRQGRIDQPIHDQIGLGCPGLADTAGLIRLLNMKASGIDFGVNGHGLNPQSFTGLHDSNSDFAAIGDQNLCKHRFCLTGECCRACGRVF